MSINLAKDVLAALGQNPNACQSRSLFMDKFADPDSEARRNFLESVIKKSAFPLPRSSFPGNLSVSFELVLAGRLIINQAVGIVENAGLCIDRHTGEPYIPGSALKGVAADAAREIGAPAEERAAVFGFSPGDMFSKNECQGLIKKHPQLKEIKNFAGTVAFLPAYPAANAALTLDIVNCHHADYYKGRQPYAFDNESPIPNVFPVVEAEVKFRFVLMQLAACRIDYARNLFGLSDAFNPLTKAAEWLKYALQNHGIGAKTAAGYGWFKVEGVRGDKQAIGVAGAAGQPATPKSDYDDRSFENAVLSRITRKGEWNQLAAEAKKLKKPENKIWAQKFFDATRGRECKELRQQSWYIELFPDGKRPE